MEVTRGLLTTWTPTVRDVLGWIKGLPLSCLSGSYCRERAGIHISLLWLAVSPVVVSSLSPWRRILAQWAWILLATCHSHTSSTQGEWSDFSPFMQSCSTEDLPVHAVNPPLNCLHNPLIPGMLVKDMTSYLTNLFLVLMFCRLYTRSTEFCQWDQLQASKNTYQRLLVPWLDSIENSIDLIERQHISMRNNRLTRFYVKSLFITVTK